MTDNTGIRGRTQEIAEIKNFIDTKIDNDRSGILYITGPPGTGKTMSVQYVLNNYPKNPKLFINCMKAQNQKSILKEICYSVGLKKCIDTEQSMVSALNTKFASRAKAQIIVLDELDHIPKSKNLDLIRKIFSWPSKEGSKLILIGIANTLNLTAKYQLMNAIIGPSHSQDLKKILFKPYSKEAITNILQWYVENDANYEDANLYSKVIDMIASKFSRERNGDIRDALNALKSSIDDTVSDNYIQITNQSSKNNISDISTTLMTPPSTPIPCKERQTNILSVANSIKKRQRKTIFKEDSTPMTHQVIMGCIHKLYSIKKGQLIDLRECKKLVTAALKVLVNMSLSDNDFRQMLMHLEVQGMIVLKRTFGKDKINLKPGFEVETSDLVKEKEKIISVINSLYSKKQ